MNGPSWYSSNYAYRVPIVVDGSATASGTVDAAVTIPPTLARFWATVQSTGYDVRFTAADGITTLAYNRASWTYASKIGIFNVDAITHSVTNTMTVIWMYWGYASATDGSTSPTISSALTGYISLLRGPLTPLLGFGPVPVGATAPRVELQQRTTEERRLWFGPLPLAQRDYLYEGSLALEGPASLSTSQEVGYANFTTAALRLVELGGRLFVHAETGAGVSGNNWRLGVRVVTTEGIALESTFQLYFQDLG